MSTWEHTRAQLANEYRWARERGTDPDETRMAELRQRLKAERLESDIRRRLAVGPELTADQLAQLATVLTTAAAEAEAEAGISAADVAELDLDASGLQDCGLGGGLRGGDAA